MNNYVTLSTEKMDYLAACLLLFVCLFTLLLLVHIENVFVTGQYYLPQPDKLHKSFKLMVCFFCFSAQFHSSPLHMY